jgi:hypothetical protein
VRSTADSVSSEFERDTLLPAEGRAEEMTTRNLPAGKKRPAHKAGNLTAICEPII